MSVTVRFVGRAFRALESALTLACVGFPEIGFRFPSEDRGTTEMKKVRVRPSDRSSLRQIIFPVLSRLNDGRFSFWLEASVW